MNETNRQAAKRLAANAHIIDLGDGFMDVAFEAESGKFWLEDLDLKLCKVSKNGLTKHVAIIARGWGDDVLGMGLSYDDWRSALEKALVDAFEKGELSGPENTGA